MESIQCLPTGLCSYNYWLNGETIRASIEYDWLTEQGHVSVNGAQYQVVKHGFSSGRWTLEDINGAILAGQKLNPFTRSLEITMTGTPDRYKLQPESAFTRTMTLSGPDTNCLIKTDHPFTRRASISGTWRSFELVVFSFWLTGLIWKRSQQSSNA